MKIPLLALALTAFATVAVAADDPSQPQHKKHRPVIKFERLDVNDDGYLDLNELLTPALAKSERVFDRKDVDDSGDLSLDEYATGRAGRDLSDIAEEIVECVADLKEETGNPLIHVPDPDAFKSPAEKFEIIDDDGNGLLGLDEVQSAVAQKVGNGFAAADTSGDSLLSLREYLRQKKTGKATRRAIRICVQELQAEDDVI